MKKSDTKPRDDDATAADANPSAGGQDAQEDRTFAFGPLSEDGKSYASTAVNLARIGLNQVAYVRPAVIDNVPVWSIHAATGDAIGAARTFDQAWGAIKQHDLEPLRVH